MTFVALTIAGSDSGGGAGLQADLKTFSALGVYGCSVVAALTAQNTKGVFAVEDVSPNFICAQMDAVFSDLDIGAVKIGMLSRVATIEAVANSLRQYRPQHVVLDPVMVSATGAQLLQKDAIAALVELLFPLASIVTPNLPEAAALLGCAEAQNETQMREQALEIFKLGTHAVLLKGGHGQGSQCIDVLYDGEGFECFSSVRLPTHNTHGTGCTLSSAIAAGLAKGLTLQQSVQQAKNYLNGALAQADDLRIGHGCGPVHHFHQFWKV